MSAILGVPTLEELDDLSAFFDGDTEDFDFPPDYGDPCPTKNEWERFFREAKEEDDALPDIGTWENPLIP